MQLCPADVIDRHSLAPFVQHIGTPILVCYSCFSVLYCTNRFMYLPASRLDAGKYVNLLFIVQ
jgi:hypothetical protein